MDSNILKFYKNFLDDVGQNVLEFLKNVANLNSWWLKSAFPLFGQDCFFDVKTFQSRKTASKGNWFLRNLQK